MANLVDKSGDAYSNLVQGNGTGSLSFPMPGTVPLDVESVVATIDNTAGTATTATLVVRDSAGEVIATKRMGDTFPAGATGTVTFSLRNSDSGGGDGIKFDTLNVGDWLSVETTTAGAPFGGGINFTVDAGDFNVSALAGQVFIDGSATSIFSEDSDMVIDSHQDIQVFSRGGGANDWDIAGTLSFLMGDNFIVQLVAGKSVTVLDHLGAAIFRVNEDGSLQGKTGKTLTFNL